MGQLITIDSDEKGILKKPCEKVKSFGNVLMPIINNMFDVMYEHKGVGLAAPQIGINKNIIIAMDRYYVNPDIVGHSKETIVEEEGCLSLPGKFLPVERYKEITLCFQDTDRRMYVRKYHGLEARIIQHEVDHLSGRCIILG